MQFLIDIILTLVYFLAFFLVVTWSWRFWKMYVNQKYLNKVNSDAIMLEIRLPRDIMKSPVAMEVALTSLLQSGGVGTWYHRNFLGNLPVYSSLEIASLEGIIHFYARIDKKFKLLVESNLYAQYPGIEISEVEDYTKRIRYTHQSKDVKMWGIAYKLGKTWNPTDPKTGKSYPDPEKPNDDKAKYSMKADYLPIKTYVDYGLDKDPKEEFKTDPLVTLLEYMGSIGKGENLWYQILVQDAGVYDGTKMPKLYVDEVSHEHITLADMAKARRDQIRSGEFFKKGREVEDEYGYIQDEKTKEGETPKPKTYQKDVTKTKKDIDLTPEEKDELEVIGKKMSKPLAAVVIRLIYVVDSNVGKFDIGNIQNMLAFPKPFAGANTLGYAALTDPYDYPWQKLGGRGPAWRAEEMFEEFVEREGFYPHIPDRKNPDTSFDTFLDRFFWDSSMESRKIFRMVFEVIVHPFAHPHPSKVSTLNLEELATLWHFPGQVAATPTLPRIDSTKGVAPVNLPQ